MSPDPIPQLDHNGAIKHDSHTASSKVGAELPRLLAAHVNPRDRSAWRVFPKLSRPAMRGSGGGGLDRARLWSSLERNGLTVP